MTVARVTQEYVEVGAIPNDQTARVTQCYVEVGAIPNDQTARVTQCYVEVGVVDIVAPPATGGQVIVFICT